MNRLHETLFKNDGHSLSGPRFYNVVRYVGAIHSFISVTRSNAISIYSHF